MLGSDGTEGLRALTGKQSCGEIPRSDPLSVNEGYNSTRADSTSERSGVGPAPLPNLVGVYMIEDIYGVDVASKELVTHNGQVGFEIGRAHV